MRFGTAGDPTTDDRYMIHCHSLPHHDMTTQFRVGNDVDDVKDPNCNDPINADPAATSPT